MRRGLGCIALLALVLSLLAGAAAAAGSVQRITQASLGVDGEPARAVELPLHWDIAEPGRSARLRLDLQFEAPQPADGPWVAVIPRLGNAWRVSLNGQVLAEAGELDTPNHGWAAKRPLRVVLPAALLQADNRLGIELRADSGRRAGLSRVQVGPAPALRGVWAQQEWLRITLPQAASVLSLLVAGFCALLWWQQHDRLYAAAALGELAWGLRLADTWWEASPVPWPWWGLAVLALFWVWTGALYALVHAVWQGQRPRHEGRAVLALLLAGPPCFAIAALAPAPWALVAWMLGSLLLWAFLALRLGWDAARRPEWARVLVALAVLACVLAIGRDIYAGRASPLHYEESAWTKYAAVTLALAVLAIVSQRFQRARKDLVALNRSVQARVEARERELAERLQQVARLERDQAVNEERSRILRDMHDGAGAHLIAAIHQVERGTGSRQDLLHTLQESLDQLRLSVDALHLPPGDINALLASLRYRLERRITAAGLRLVWQADELPLLPDWQGAQMRHLQFILLEGMSNVIQHAGAATLTVRATAPDGRVRIELLDDGVGSGDGPAGHQGNGRRSMQERAALIGAQMALHAHASGTRLVLQL